MTLYVRDRVVMVDRYASRRPCVCKSRATEPSWFDGMKGEVTQVSPYVMVLLDGERLPLRFDARDFDRVESEPHMTAGG